MALRLFASSISRCRNLTRVSRLSTTAFKYSSGGIPTDLEVATGVERKELEAILDGNEDPFNLHVTKGAPGTREAPTLVPSMYEERIVGCVCNEDATSIAWMVLKKGASQRCHCGYYYQLVRGKTSILADD